METPGFFIQASNGALVMILLWMLMFSFMYLMDQWRRYNRDFRSVYYVSKMAIAMAVFQAGFLLDRISAAIWMKHIIPGNHYNLSLVSLPMFMLVAGAMTAITGGSCWIRVLAPERGPLCSWPVVMLTSILFGWLIAVS